MFNFKLNEAIFDDDLDSFLTKDTPMQLDNIDDDFSEYIDEHSVEDVLPGPAEGTATGVAGEIIALINDEWEAITGYNNAIATLRAVVAENPVYAEAIKVLEEISAEENVHVGQLQEVLKLVSPNAAEIKKGEAEAKSQLGLVGGRLPVQSWDTPVKSETPAEMIGEEEVCTLCDVDDDM